MADKVRQGVKHTKLVLNLRKSVLGFPDEVSCSWDVYGAVVRRLAIFFEVVFLNPNH